MGWDKHCTWCFPFNSKLWKFLSRRSNGTDHLCPVRPEYLRPQLKVVHFHQSGHFIAPFHLTKLLSLLPLLLQNMQWLGSDKFSWLYHSIQRVKFPKFQSWILLNRKCSLLIWQSCALAAPGGPWCLHVTFAPRWPDNHMQGILDFMGSEHWAPFNFSYSKASYENEITPSHECHSSFLFPWFWFFFWRTPQLHQQLMFIKSLSKMKLCNISYMYNVLTAVNDWLWQKNSSELQLICLV